MSFLDAIKRNPEPVSVQVGDETFYVAKLSAADHDRLRVQWSRYRDASGSVYLFRGFVVAFCLCDEQGVKQYDSGQDEQPEAAFMEVAEAVMQGDNQIVESVFSVAAKANGLVEADEKN